MDWDGRGWVWEGKRVCWAEAGAGPFLLKDALPVESSMSANTT